MKLWSEILAGALPAAAILAGILFLWYRRRRRRRSLPDATPQFTETGAKLRSDSLGAVGHGKLHLPIKSTSTRASLRFHHLLHHRPHNPAANQKPPFDWADHPQLVAEAVENGWSRFAFADDGDTPPDAAEGSWELPLGSSEYMQTVRLNPGEGDPALCRVRMSLPLPGPPLGGGGGGGSSSFPQEAYFEITILYLKPQHQRSSRAGDGSSGKSDRAKLIKENSMEARSDALIHAIKGGGGGGLGIRSPIQEPNTSKDEVGKPPIISLGLTVGGSPPSKTAPGTYPGSIAFNSTGSVYLDGMKLISESERAEWAAVNRVVGCGYDPGKKKVYFTMDSQLMHTIHCHSDAYERPLYPVLTSDTDVMVLVNLGQGRFRYAPTNAHRTPNPSFFNPSSGRGGWAEPGSEDSKDLFSVERPDAEWFDAAKSNADTDAESDLFEIALQS